ncbi:MAG TPA: hypothetical protein P5230_03040 [Candidatus Magasanikbacteria bacterium]|nr:hypothetical protein [Candidatus Magasanikbacteria bacterium]
MPSESGIVFVSANHCQNPEMVVEEFDRGIKDFAIKKPEKRVLCAHTGQSYEIGRKISDCMQIKPIASSFLEAEHDQKAMISFIKNYASACTNGELVYVVVNFNQMKFIRKNFNDHLACYFVGKRYGIR